MRNFSEKPGPHRRTVLHGLIDRAMSRSLLYGHALTSDHLTLLLRRRVGTWHCDLFYNDVQGMVNQVAQKPDNYCVVLSCRFHSCVNLSRSFRCLLCPYSLPGHSRNRYQPWSQHLGRSNYHYLLVYEAALGRRHYNLLPQRPIRRRRCGCWAS